MSQPSPATSNILMWTECEECKHATKPVPMSDGMPVTVYDKSYHKFNDDILFLQVSDI